MNHYPRHVGDYLKDTAHLSLLEHGCYGRMLDVYYTREGPLPVEVPAVCRLVGASNPVEKRAVEAVLREFFLQADDGWHQSRADAEIGRYKEKSDKAAASATARWSNSDRNANASANATTDAMRTHSEGNANQNHNQNRKPTNSTIEPRAARKAAIPKPDDISDSVWQDFIALRKAKKAPLTETALQGIRDQAGLARISLEAALRMCCERGWQGFKAEWMLQGTQGRGMGNQREDSRLAASRSIFGHEPGEERTIDGTATHVD